jgi:hypothetical protein
MKKLFVVTAVVALLCMGVAAQAATINYTVGNWTMRYPGPVTPPAGAPPRGGYPGDTLDLQTYTTGTLDLTPGTYVQKINTFAWTVDYTYAGTATDPSDWSELSFSVAAPRSISVGTASGSLSQTGLLEVNWDTDYVHFDEGSATTIFVEGYRVDITPLALARDGAGGWGDGPWVQAPRDVMARFDVSAAPPVPEPMSIMLGIMGLGSVAGFKRLRRK